MTDPPEGVAAGTPIWVRLLVVLVVVGLGIWVLSLRDEVASPVARGVVAPGFSLPSLDGDAPVVLEDLRGQVVMLNFWATWCKPCEEEMPAMDRLYRALRPEGFEMLAVSVDEESGVVHEFRERLGVGFPIRLEPAQNVAGAYQTTGFPESLLIAKHGMIVERYIGPRDWDHASYAERIRRLMADR